MISDINLVLEFFINLYESKCSYSTINTARSALSLILSPVDGFNVGCHPLVIRILKGIGRARPPQPRYNSVWNADVVLKLIHDWDLNELLSIKQLTCKLASLLMLCTGQRAQTIHAIRVSKIVFSSRVEIVIPDRLKTSRKGTVQPTLILPFNSDPQLCVAKALQEYIKRTSVYRKVDNLFLSLEKPHCAVSKQTVSRWLVWILKEAGVNVDIFKSHSYRHCSVSRAATRGIDTDTIYKCAGWSLASTTFAKFYNRPIDNSENYGLAVLSL